MTWDLTTVRYVWALIALMTVTLIVSVTVGLTVTASEQAKHCPTKTVIAR